MHVNVHLYYIGINILLGYILVTSYTSDPNFLICIVANAPDFVGLLIYTRFFYM